jgi:D-3-phosphoglycerate dehydrogenase / 2-oxoglutarate reductase
MTMSYRIVFTDPEQHTFESELLAALRAAGAQFDIVSDRSAENLARECRDADGVITSAAQISAPIIDQMEKCRIIARVGTGYDNVDHQAAARRGIPVTNVPNFCTEEVATHTIALLLAIHRQITTLNREVRERTWNPDRVLPAERLSTKTLGLVGFGAIARAVAARAAAFGMRIEYFDPFVESVAAVDGISRRKSLNELLSRADFVSLHVPLNDETTGLMGHEQFAAMKRSATLINTSRGRVVDEAALVDALASGTIAGAALDVLECEPPASNNRLLRMPNVVLTPHCASHSTDSLREVRRRAVEEVVRALRGEPLMHVVNHVPRRIDD